VEVDDDTLTISVSYGPLDAMFKGRFTENGESNSGGWRSNPGADDSVNVPYDIGGRRIRCRDPSTTSVSQVYTQRPV
jgi:hypothetical protein